MAAKVLCHLGMREHRPGEEPGFVIGSSRLFQDPWQKHQQAGEPEVEEERASRVSEHESPLGVFPYPAETS